MREILFWGASGQAKVLNDALRGSGVRLIALVDNRELPSPFVGVPVLRGETGLQTWLAQRARGASLLFSVAIGGARGADRLGLSDLLKRLGLLPHTIIHPAAYVATDSIIGEGCQVLAHATICTHAKLGAAVIVNTAASVDHDCKLGDGAHIGPGAHLAGEVFVGARAFVGIGATVLPRVCIGEDAIVGGGAVVTRDVASGTVVVGNPARLLQRRTRSENER